jgi:hypothetical protein
MYRLTQKWTCLELTLSFTVAIDSTTDTRLFRRERNSEPKYELLPENWLIIEFA